MGTLNLSMILLQHQLVNHVPVNWFYRIMGLFLSSCWLLITNSVFWVLKFATNFIPFRLSSEDESINFMFFQNRGDGISEFSKMFGFDELVGREEQVSENKLSLQEPESIDFEEVFGAKNQIMKTEEPNYGFKFHFQTDKDLKERLGESSDGLSGFFSDTNSIDDISDANENLINSYAFLSEKDFRDFVTESSVGSSSTHDFFSEKEFSDTSLEDELLSEKDFVQIDSEKFYFDQEQFEFPSSEPRTEHSEKETKKPINPLLDSNREKTEDLQEMEETQIANSNLIDDGEDSNIEIRTELSDKETQKPINPLLDSNGEKTEDLQKIEEIQVVNTNLIYDGEDSNSLEIMWEHQDLIEQLRTELRKVRAVGLPTILEESECPKVVDDLKPWKIDEKFLKEEKMDELQKFYKSYRERMRKFDIWNYQKMYATGFLKMKDPLRVLTSQRATFPVISRQNLWLSRGRKSKVDPSEKFMRELQEDLETVYVGQACLSWEILHWQYGKAKELSESDPHGFRRYDEVAGELQQFHVLLYRFLENEPFEGTGRVENYVGNRCVLRNLLQVPLVREEKRSERRRGNDGVTITMLVGILEESIRVFWNFIKADKGESNGVFKGFLATQTELQDPSFSQLLTDTQMNLQKKEKKLKDLVRGENCLVKKFQKQQASGSEDQLLLFSQVDMKLVSRVLRMSRITGDQLLWCHKKLNKINFRGRKLHREPSFLLFPC